MKRLLQQDFNSIEDLLMELNEFNRNKPDFNQETRMVENFSGNQGQAYYFKRSPTFQGSMEGWVFTTKEEGTGYYLDA